MYGVLDVNALAVLFSVLDRDEVNTYNLLDPLQAISLDLIGLKEGVATYTL